MKEARIGCDCNIGDAAFIESGAVLGDRVTIKNQVMVWDGVTIEDDAFVGPGVIFTNDMYPRSPRMPEIAVRYGNPDYWRVRTVIRRGASLGAGAVILPGTTVGEFALVAAGAVVTRDVVPYQLVLGNPARHHGWVCVCAGRLDENGRCLRCSREFPIERGNTCEGEG
jgi:acetyltransferase-like isoleucine patch superfamily enzyme